MSAAVPSTGLQGALSLSLLERLQVALERVDLGQFLNQQRIYVRTPGWQPACTEFFFDLQRLRQTCFPSVDLQANERLFVEFTRHLDDLMLVRLLSARPWRQEPGWSS